MQMKNNHTTCLIILSFAFCTSSQQNASINSRQFSEKLIMDSYAFLSSGWNTYILLEFNYHVSFKRKELKDPNRPVSNVMKEIYMVNNIETKVIKEKICK